MNRLAPLGLLALAACSASADRSTAAAPSGSTPSPRASDGQLQQAGSTVPGPSLAPGSPITRIEVAGALSADGSAQSPSTTFDHGHDRKLIAVLTLSGVGAGTKLSYVRYLDGKYVDSKSALTTGNARHFYFEFAAQPEKALTAGLYRLRLYVAEHLVGEVSYRVQ